MKRFRYLQLASFAIVLVALFAAPNFSSAQQSANPAPPAPPASPAAALPHVKPMQHCASIDLCAEQIGDLARSISQEVCDQLAELKDEIAEEVDMSSPELSKLRDLSAEMADNRKELAELGAEIGARGSELAQEIQEQTQEFITDMPMVRANVSEEGGGWLGIEIAEITQEKARELKLSAVRGVVVTDVEPDSPAAKSGLKEKDVITQYDSQPVEGTVQFRRLVRETPPGRTISLTVSRDGSTQNISVELGDRSAYFEKKMKGKMRDFSGMNLPTMPSHPFPDMPEGMDRRTPVLGINAEDLTGQLGEFFGAPDSAGVLIREVRSGTPAEKAGLKAGDVIVKVGDQPVRSVADLREQLRAKSAEKSVNIGILRKGSPMTLPVAIEVPRPGDSMHRMHHAQS